jgi:23S rRNA pseudouridine1911/1915/1917 synthase
MTPHKNETWQKEIKVPPLEKPTRIDRFISDRSDLELTRNRIQHLIADSLILVNGNPITKNFQLKGGERILLTVPSAPLTDIAGENIPLDIIFEDEELAVVNKPAGLVVHPAPGHYTGTMVNALIHRFQKLGGGSGVERPGIIHRLDKGTSGLLIVARTDRAYQILQQQMQQQKIKKTYLALVCGHVKKKSGEIDLPIGRSSKDRKKMMVTEGSGREAVTRYKVQEQFRSYDLLEVELLTGRTHQIRVHFSHLGHPVFGDPEYGGREKWHRGIFGPERLFGRRLLELIDRQALHAVRLEFTQPLTKAEMRFEAPLPPDIFAVLSLLRREGN